MANIAFQFDRQGRAVAAFATFGVYISLKKACHSLPATELFVRQQRRNI